MTIAPQTLESVCVSIVDCEHKTAPLDPEGEYFAVGTPAMRGNKIDLGQARRISEETFRAWTRRLAPRYGDLLLAREAPVGPVVLIPRDARVAPGQRTVLLRPDPEQVDPRFLYYLLTSPAQQARLLQNAEGSTVAHLNVADVRSFQLPPLPPLQQQLAIAELLGLIDEKIDTNRNTLRVGQELVRAHFDAIADRSDSYVRVGAVVTESRTKVRSQLGQAPVVLSAVATGHLRRSDDYFNKQVYSKSIENYLLVRPGDVAYNPARANIGSIGFNDLDTFGAVSPVYVVASVSDNWREWLRCALTTSRVVDQIRILSSGSVRQNLRFSDFASMELPAPSPSSLESFTQMVREWRERAASLEVEIASLASLRDTLLPNLLSGHVRVASTEFRS